MAGISRYENQLNSNDGCRIVGQGDFFEWWYFDFDLKSQHHIYIEWHAPMFNLRDNYGTLIIRVYGHQRTFLNNNKKPEGPITKVFRYHRSLIAQNGTSCEIVFPAGHIIERDSNYFINVNERDLLIDLKLERLLPRLDEYETLYCTRGGNEFFSWNVPLPRALATGKIKLDGEYIDVEGTAYHDHNWGNLNIGKHLLGWIWARVLFDDFTLIFGDIANRESERKVQILLFADKNGRKMDTSSLQVDYISFTGDNRHNLPAPAELIITFEDNNKYRAHLRVENSFAVQEAPLGSFKSHFLNSLVTKAYYLFKLNNAPNIIKKRLGRLLYSQAVVKGKLYMDDRLIDTKTGRLEVFSCAD